MSNYDDKGNWTPLVGRIAFGGMSSQPDFAKALEDRFRRKSLADKKKVADIIIARHSGPCFVTKHEPDELARLRSENARQDKIIEEQRQSIVALNACIGGEGSLTTDNMVRVARLSAERDALSESKRALVDALEKLSCLGNGDQPGNSTGNTIAQNAIFLSSSSTDAAILARRDAETLERAAEWFSARLQNDYANPQDELRRMAQELRKVVAE